MSRHSRFHGAISGFGCALLLLCVCTTAATAQVQMVSGGSMHTLCLRGNDTVTAWGYNSSGQLGIGNNFHQNTPQLIPNLSGVHSIACGKNFSIARLINGNVKASGDNWAGQLGLGHNNNHNTYQLIPALVGVSRLAAGGDHSMARLTNGTVKAWGSNVHGQLGLGHNIDQNTPQLIPTLSGVLHIAAGDNHSLALLQGSGTVMAWGRNQSGQLGLGHNINQNTPQLIPNLSGVQSIVCGANYSMALLGDGTVMVWGANGLGQLGLGNTIDQNTPQTVNCPSVYTLSLEHSATDITANMTCAGTSAAFNLYFNVFSADVANATSWGTGNWFGLHVDSATLSAHFDLAMAGFPLVIGQLDGFGNASASMGVPTAALAGLTLYGVSIVFDPFISAITQQSLIIEHGF